MHEDLPAASYSTDLHKFSASIVQSIEFLLLQCMKKLKINHHPRRGLSDIYIEGISMGEELCDAYINLAQRLPIIGYSSLNWVAYNLRTLLQQKRTNT